MSAVHQREFKLDTTRSGNHCITRSTISCSKCPTDETIDLARRYPDEVLRKKFRDRGWLLSRDRRHDVCPGCLGVTPENRLAAIFPVKRDGQAVPTTADCVDRAEHQRDQDRARTRAAIDRHFPQKPVPAAQIPAPPPAPASASDSRVDALLLEMSQMRAAMELQLEASQELVLSNRRLTEQADINQHQNAQLIEAIARLAGNSGRQNEAILDGLGQAANALTGLIKLGHERAWPKPPRDFESLPRCKPIPQITRRTAFTEAIDARMQGRPSPLPPIDEADRRRLAAERERRVAERSGRGLMTVE